MFLTEWMNQPYPKIEVTTNSLMGHTNTQIRVWMDSNNAVPCETMDEARTLAPFGAKYHYPFDCDIV